MARLYEEAVVKQSADPVVRTVLGETGACSKSARLKPDLHRQAESLGKAAIDLPADCNTLGGDLGIAAAADEERRGMTIAFLSLLSPLSSLLVQSHTHFVQRRVAAGGYKADEEGREIGAAGVRAIGIFGFMSGNFDDFTFHDVTWQLFDAEARFLARLKSLDVGVVHEQHGGQPTRVTDEANERAWIDMGAS